MPTEPGTYIEALKLRLLLDELVQSFDIIREEETPLRAYFISLAHLTTFMTVVKRMSNLGIPCI
jgi:hypothetical protein